MANVLIAAIGVTACAWDLHRHRIPNVLTFGAAFAGIITQILAAGWLGALAGLAGWAIGIGLFFPFFALRGMGAGDVKLLGAFGAWLGPAHVIVAAIAAALIGGFMAVAVVIQARRMRQMAMRLSSMAFFWSADGLQPVPGITLSEPSHLALSYSLPITAGALVAILLGS